MEKTPFYSSQKQHVWKKIMFETKWIFFLGNVFSGNEYFSSEYKNKKLGEKCFF